MHSSVSSTASGSAKRKFFEEKAGAKAALQRDLGWPEEHKQAMLCLPMGMTEQLGGDLLKDLIPGILTLPVNLLIRGKGSAAFGTLFTRLAKEHGHRIAIVANAEPAVERMLIGCDAALFLHDPGDAIELKASLACATVPLAPPHELLQDYNPNQESGNAFIFEQATTWHAFAAIVRALETFRFPYDWRTIQAHGMETIGR